MQKSQRAENAIRSGNTFSKLQMRINTIVEKLTRDENGTGNWAQAPRGEMTQLIRELVQILSHNDDPIAKGYVNEIDSIQKQCLHRADYVFGLKQSYRFRHSDQTNTDFFKMLDLAVQEYANLLRKLCSENENWKVDSGVKVILDSTGNYVETIMIDGNSYSKVSVDKASYASKLLVCLKEMNPRTKEELTDKMGIEWSQGKAGLQAWLNDQWTRVIDFTPRSKTDKEVRLKSDVVFQKSR